MPILPAQRPQQPGGAPERSYRPIQLGPGLLVYLDALKRRQFLDAWRGSMLPPNP